MRPRLFNLSPLHKNLNTAIRDYDMRCEVGALRRVPVTFGEVMRGSGVSPVPAEYFTARRRRHATDRCTVTGAAHRSTLAKTQSSQNRAGALASLIATILGLMIILSLLIGWLGRDDNGLSADSGIGYWLGVAGMSFMLVSLVYPLRKRWLRGIGTVSFWFHAHMTLGAIGSALICWHANFKLGSMNDSVALAAVLVVATSGVVGRYLYGRIRRGLYGQKAAIGDLLVDVEISKASIATALPVADRVIAELRALGRHGAAAPNGILAAVLQLPATRWRGWVVRRRVIAEVHRVIAVEGRRRGWPQGDRRRCVAEIADLVSIHLAAVKKARTLELYERVFSAWHVLHIPLFFLLVLATIVHVFAAHFF